MWNDGTISLEKEQKWKSLLCILDTAVYISCSASVFWEYLAVVFVPSPWGFCCLTSLWNDSLRQTALEEGMLLKAWNLCGSIMQSWKNKGLFWTRWQSVLENLFLFLFWLFIYYLFLLHYLKLIILTNSIKVSPKKKKKS